MPLPFEISDNPIGLAVVENDNEIKLILGRLDHSSGGNVACRGVDPNND